MMMNQRPKENVVWAFMDIASLKNMKGMLIVNFPCWSIIVIDKEIQLKVLSFYKKGCDGRTAL